MRDCFVVEREELEELYRIMGRLKGERDESRRWCMMFFWLFVIATVAFVLKVCGVV